jgi:endonuclease/exonuclease/phosphatase family metal-dependent hydrolase
VRLTIMQWNVRFSEPVERLLPVIREVNAEVVCLQEITENTEFNPGICVSDIIAQSLHYSDTHFTAASRSKYQDRSSFTGNAILSRLPITQKLSFTIKDQGCTSNRFDPHRRIYLEARIQLGKESVTVGCVHSSYTDQFRNDSIKEREIDRLVRTIEQNQRRFILAGDFNSPEDSYTIGRMRGILKDSGPEGAATWTTKPQKFQQWTAAGLQWKLDYVFHTPDLRLVSCQTHTTGVSDHLPLICVMEF